MNQRRRILMALGALPLMTGPMAFATTGKNYLSRPLTIIIPFPAGGPTDAVGRIIASKLGPRIGQPVIIENKGGAAGNIGMHAAAMAEPDGHTIVLIAPTAAVNPSLYKLPFDTLVDLTPLTQHVSLQYMLVVNPDLPVTNVAELIELAKKRDKPLSYGSWGVGSHAQLCAVQLEAMAGIEMIHVPYRGAAPAMTDVMSGQIDLMFDSIATATVQAKANNVRALAVSSTERSASMPDVPPIADTLPGYNITGWQAFMAPGKTPRDKLEFLQQEIAIVLHDDEVKKQLEDMGLTVVGSRPDEFDTFFRSELDQYANLIKMAGITLD